jgi:hypothetical protein
VVSLSVALMPKTYRLPPLPHSCYMPRPPHPPKIIHLFFFMLLSQYLLKAVVLPAFNLQQTDIRCQKIPWMTCRNIFVQCPRIPLPSLHVLWPGATDDYYLDKRTFGLFRLRTTSATMDVWTCLRSSNHAPLKRAVKRLMTSSASNKAHTVRRFRPCSTQYVLSLTKCLAVVKL